MREAGEYKILFDPSEFLGREIANVTLVEVLGRGAMGAVYIAYQKSLKRKVALKLFPKLKSQSDSVRLRFRDEAETVAVLSHPNIAPVFDMGETDEFLFIVMQLVSGEDLRSIIRRQLLHPVPSRRTIPVKQALEIMIPVLDGLQFAHHENVIHQDIKPANIIIEENSGRPCIVDFGIARTAVTDDGPSQLVLGTPLYMSPEQVKGLQTDARSDIYSAGIVLYETIAGRIRVQASSLEDLLRLKAHNPECVFSCSPSQCCSSIDIDLEKIILKAIAVKREDRYQNCAGFQKDLISYCETRFGGNK